MNGHACGDPNRYPFRCELDGGSSTGECKFGIKQRAYLLDKFRNDDDTLSSIREFRAWLVNAMVQAQFLEAVCLPPDANGCQSEFDEVRTNSAKNTAMAIEETLNIFEAIEMECICPCKTIEVDRVFVRSNTDQGDDEVKVFFGVERFESDKNDCPGSPGKNRRCYQQVADFGKVDNDGKEKDNIGFKYSKNPDTDDYKDNPGGIV